MGFLSKLVKMLLVMFVSQAALAGPLDILAPKAPFEGVDIYDTANMYNEKVAGKAGAACMADTKADGTKGENQRFFPSGDRFPKHCFDYSGSVDLSPTSDLSKDGGKLVYLKMRPLDDYKKDKQWTEYYQQRNLYRHTFPRAKDLGDGSKIPRKEREKVIAALKNECERVKKIIQDNYGGFAQNDRFGTPGGAEDVVTFYMPPRDPANPNAMNLHLLPQVDRHQPVRPPGYPFLGPQYFEPYVMGGSTLAGSKGSIVYPSVKAPPFAPVDLKFGREQHFYNCPKNVNSEYKDVVGDFKFGKFLIPGSDYQDTEEETAFKQDIVNNLNVSGDLLGEYINSCDKRDTGGNGFSLNPPVTSLGEAYNSSDSVVEEFGMTDSNGENAGSVNFRNSVVVSELGGPKVSFVESVDPAGTKTYYRVTELDGGTPEKPKYQLVKIEDNLVKEFKAKKGTKDDKESMRRRIMSLEAKPESTYFVSKAGKPRNMKDGYILGIEQFSNKCHLIQVNPLKATREIASQKCRKTKGGGVYIESVTQDWFWGPAFSKSWKECDLESDACGDIRTANGSLDAMLGGRKAYAFKARSSEDTSKYKAPSSLVVGPCTYAATNKGVFPNRPPPSVRLPASVKPKGAK
jgi:hypothetical protein